MSITKLNEQYSSTDARIAYLLRKAQHATRLKIDRALSEYGITLPQFAVLRILELEPNIHSADIARIILFSPQCTNTIITNLAEAGLLTRSAHETHGRVLEIILTEKGKKCLQHCKQKVHAIEKAMLNGLKPADEKIIRQWLVKCSNLNL